MKTKITIGENNYTYNCPICGKDNIKIAEKMTHQFENAIISSYTLDYTVCYFCETEFSVSSEVPGIDPTEWNDYSIDQLMQFAGERGLDYYAYPPGHAPKPRDADDV